MLTSVGGSKVAIRMASTLKDGKPVPVVDPKCNVDGGVEDLYGEDRATEDQLVTPWTFSVARFLSLSLPRARAHTSLLMAS